MGQLNFNSQPAPWSLNWLQQFLYSLWRSWWARCSTTAQLWLPQSTTPSTTPHPPPTPLHPPHMPPNHTTLLPTPTVTQKLHPSALRAATFPTVSSTLSIPHKISQDALFLKKYADVADQSANDLVQDITK